MAVLSETDRTRVWRVIMRYWSSVKESCGINKSELRAAVDAVDNWIDTNASTYNAAIPQPARSNLTVEQKALLLSVVALMRISPDILARIVVID